MRTLCLILFGIFLSKFTDGMVPSSRFGEENLHSYSTELLKPLMSKTNDLNNTIQDAWNLYDKNMKRIDSKLKGQNKLRANDKNADLDTCANLLDTMGRAQNTVNNATVILVEVLQKMASTIDNAPSCVTINIFSAVSCVAHKAQDVRNIYSEYKNKIVENETAAAKALGEIAVEFINCLKKL